MPNPKVIDLSQKLKEKKYRCPNGHEYTNSNGGWRITTVLAMGPIGSAQVACPLCYVQVVAALCPAYEVDAMGNMMGYKADAAKAD